MKSFSLTSCSRAVMVTRSVAQITPLCVCATMFMISLPSFSSNVILRCFVSTALTAAASTRVPCTRKVPRALAIMPTTIILIKQFPIFSHHQQFISAPLTFRPTLSITSRTHSTVWRHRATHPIIWQRRLAAAHETDRSRRPTRTWTICKTTRRRMFSIFHLWLSCPRSISSIIIFNVGRRWSGTSRKIDWGCRRHRQFSKIPHRHSKCAAVHFRFSTCRSIRRRLHHRPSPPSRCSSTCQKTRSFPFFTGSTAKVYRTIWTRNSSSRFWMFAPILQHSTRCLDLAKNIYDSSDCESSSSILSWRCTTA